MLAAPTEVEEPDRLSAGEGKAGSPRLSPLRETELARRFPRALADGPAEALSVLVRRLRDPASARSESSLIGRRRSRRAVRARRASATPPASVKLASISKRGSETAKA